VSGPTLQLMM